MYIRPLAPVNRVVSLFKGVEGQLSENIKTFRISLKN